MQTFLQNRVLSSAFLRSCACSVHEFENQTSENYDSDSNFTKLAWNIKVKGYETIPKSTLTQYFQKTKHGEVFLGLITSKRKNTQMSGCFKIGLLKDSTTSQNVFLLCTSLVVRNKDAMSTRIPQALLSCVVIDNF